jgi:integrase
LAIPVGRKPNGLVIHSLRHFFETRAVDSGVPQFVVDQWMGHAGHGLMGRTYYGFSDHKSLAFMQQVKF